MRSGEKRAQGGFRWLSRGVWARAAAALLVLQSVGCDDEAAADDAHRDLGDVTTSFQAPPESVSRALTSSFRETRLFEDIATGLNDTFKFPIDLPVRHLSCGEANAFYDPARQELSMCYELLTAIANVAYDPSVSETEVAERIVGTWMFVFFHELGHGLVDMYELPVTGREEDAVDDFSTLLLIDMDLAAFAIRAAEYWASMGSSVESELAYADEHSLNAQRFYAILCLVYGSDPDKYEALVTEGHLPAARAARCPSEFQTKQKAWEQLLSPWLK